MKRIGQLNMMEPGV